MPKTLYFSKTGEVNSPQRGTSCSAGIDFFIPKFTPQFLDDFISKNRNISIIWKDCYSYYLDLPNKLLLLGPGQRILIPTCIKMRGHDHKAIIGFNKSGIGSKKGLDALACVIDEDYQGVLHINLVNTSNEMVAIHEDEKILQFLELPVDYSELKEVPESELFLKETDRGEGGFGSTNT